MSTKFNINTLPKCGARLRKKTHKLCRQPAMKNGKCRIHGGKSTGPRTPQGLENSKKSRLKHGFYSTEKIRERRGIAKFLKDSKNLISTVEEIL